MKSFSLIAVLSAVAGVYAGSTVSPKACGSPTSGEDMVTRSDDAASVSCTAPALTVMSGGGHSNGTHPTGTHMTSPEVSPTEPPTAAGNKMVGSVAGVAGVVAAVAYMI